MKKGKYLLAVDGGGTKTEYCVYNIETETTRSFLFESTNYKNLGSEKVESNLKQSFYKICNSLNMELEDIGGVVFGISGCDTKSDYAAYQSMIRHTGLNMDKVFICNDSEMAFLSVAKNPGICVVAGTGSIALGFDRSGASSRCGGWGCPLSDLGSGYWIGEQMLKKWIKYLDGQISGNEIFRDLMKFYHLEEGEDCCYAIASLNKKEIAASAKLISDRADEGNDLCKEVLLEGAEEVADIAGTVYRKLKLQKYEKMDLVSVGSIFNGSFYRQTFRKRFREKTGHENITFIKLEQSPAQAGISLVKNKFL